MRTLALIALALTATPAAHASQSYLDIAVGYNVSSLTVWGGGQSGGFAGPKDTIRFSFTVMSDSGHVFTSWTHVSHLSAGAPFNNKPEDWLDMVEVGYRFRSLPWSRN